MISITLIIIISTVIVSFIAFKNQQVMDKLIFYPPAINEMNQYYRFVTCGFIHAINETMTVLIIIINVIEII